MIRRLAPIERSKIADHLKRLDSGDRYMRFETAASDNFIDAYVRGIRFTADVAYGAFDDNLVLRGFSHICFSRGSADVGLSVERDCRGQGFGTKLLDKSIRIARLRRAKTFTSMCLMQNRWMLRAMSARGFDITREFDTAIAMADLDPPNVMTLGIEIAEENMAWMNYAEKFWFGLWD